jgi:dTDP-4-amino-4,6-dideoxygalactose transaminase
MPVHFQPAYRDLAPKNRSVSVCEHSADRVLSLPLYPELTDAEGEEVVNAVIACSERGTLSWPQ